MKESNISDFYREMGISEPVLRFGEQVLKELKGRFEEIDETAEYNQLKVLKAMQENKVSEACLLGTTGYGYNDLGRETLESVYAAVFHTQDALVRPQITCGTHALALALKPEEVRFSCDLPSDSREIYGYLNGETFREDVGVYREEGGKGWHLITADGYSVGWGKLAGGIMKNHYPKGLRKNWSC